MSVKNKIKFSIIIPTFNRAWCLERAIKSVLKQNFSKWEMIIVDDGSTDRTREIVKKYLEDKRIKYFYKKNGGVGSARNVGIKNSLGEIIILLDSDDEFMSDAFNIILGTEKRNASVNIFAFSTTTKNGNSACSVRESDRLINFSEYISKNYIIGEAFVCYRRKIFLNTDKLFDEDVNGGEGIFLWKLIMQNGMLISDKVVRIYHTESTDSLISSKITTEKMNNIYKIQKKLLDKYEEKLLEVNKKELGLIYLVLARATALLNNKRESTGYFARGVYYGKFDVKRIILYLVSLLDYNMIVNNYLNKVYNKIINE